MHAQMVTTFQVFFAWTLYSSENLFVPYYSEKYNLQLNHLLKNIKCLAHSDKLHCTATHI